MSPDLPATPENHPESVRRLATTLRTLDEAHRRYRLHAAKALGMGHTELSALVAIGETPGMTPGTLSNELLLSTGATTAVVDRLEKSGHVTRTRHPGDRRSLFLHLTAQGEDTTTILREAYQYVLSTTGTDETIAEALPQLDGIAAALDAAAREAAS
ncbi:MarR family transcriptional regulator [Frigoribacterium sp. VKM Ac-2836]|uniref:MarR family winged helix-turn-helix transcriptional regulator n=1 Tax=Frigoribacterium sp. VKM Ac-2836 TaxID=2739014 RepID=UPI001566035C|nr:MarR family transcriptional regulator [Frigoribacterium sp. VKM Ac-2836]